MPHRVLLGGSQLWGPVPMLFPFLSAMDKGKGG